MYLRHNLDRQVELGRLSGMRCADCVGEDEESEGRGDTNDPAGVEMGGVHDERAAGRRGPGRAVEAAIADEEQQSKSDGRRHHRAAPPELPVVQ